MGYGYLDEIPAPYALKYLNPATYWNLIAVGLNLPRRWPKRFVRGFERLWDDVAAQLDVRLRTSIAAIDRGGPVRIHLTDAEFIEFDYLVLACPLNSDTLGRFVTLSREEADLFKRIIVNKYAVTSYAILNLRLPKRIVGMAPIPDIGYPWAITQQYADNEFVQFYSRLDSTHATSKANVIDLIRQFTKALGAVLPEDYTALQWNGAISRMSPWTTSAAASMIDLRDCKVNRTHFIAAASPRSSWWKQSSNIPDDWLKHTFNDSAKCGAGGWGERGAGRSGRKKARRGGPAGRNSRVSICRSARFLYICQ